MYYNLESDFGNGCNTCETVPQQPMMGMQGQQPFNPYAVNTSQPNVPPQTPSVPVMQQAPQQIAVQQDGQKVAMDSAAHQAATQYNNEPVLEAPDFVNTVEGFENMGLMTDKRKMVLGVFVILVALALNECMKYYLNKGVQSCEGTSYHYLSYAVLAVFAAVLVYHFTRRMM
jgi:hypothetical protein